MPFQRIFLGVFQTTFSFGQKRNEELRKVKTIHGVPTCYICNIREESNQKVIKKKKPKVDIEWDCDKGDGTK